MIPEIPAHSAGKTVAVVGVGLVGGHLLPMLVRQPEISRLMLIDGDHFSAGNFFQNMLPEDIGQPKVAVAARLAKKIRPDLQIESIPQRFEDIPLGKLRHVDLICSAVDTRLSRLAISQTAWRLGICLVDAGVNAGQQLVRISAYVPGGDAPCLQCAWNKGDYAAIADSFSCTGALRQTPPTGASIQLGTLVAAYQCIEVSRLLSQDWANSLVSRQLIVDAGRGSHYLSQLHRSSSCHFDHHIWPVEGFVPLRFTTATLGELLSIGRGLFEKDRPAAFLNVPGRQFINQIACVCGRRDSYFAVARQSVQPPNCKTCGQPMCALAFYNSERVDLHSPPAEFLDRPLTELGFRTGDVLRFAGPEVEKFVELPELGEESPWITF